MLCMSDWTLDTRHLTRGPGLCRGRLFQNCYWYIVTSLVYKLYPRNIAVAY